MCFYRKIVQAILFYKNCIELFMCTLLSLGILLNTIVAQVLSSSLSFCLGQFLEWKSSLITWGDKFLVSRRDGEGEGTIIVEVGVTREGRGIFYGVTTIDLRGL